MLCTLSPVQLVHRVHADEVQSDTLAGREQNESVKRAPASKNGLR
jgi:hypothetical protein